MVWFTQFFGPLQGYQPTLPASPRRTLRVPAQPRTLALASDLRSSRAVHFFDHRRILAADDPSASPYAINALLPMSVRLKHRPVGLPRESDFELASIPIPTPGAGEVLVRNLYMS